MKSIKNIYLSAEKALSVKTDGVIELSDIVIAVLLAITLIYLAWT